MELSTELWPRSGRSDYAFRWSLLQPIPYGTPKRRNLLRTPSYSSYLRGASPNFPFWPRLMGLVVVIVYLQRVLLKMVREVLGVEVEGTGGDGEGGELMMELFNMLVRPEGVGVAAGERAFELRWHRDDIPATATAEEEVVRLKGPDDKYVHTQWNLPLYDDDSLIVIPGSHARARTEEERNAAPYEEHITGQVRVQLKAGDVVFYDNNILHRGVYDVAKERATLHGSVGHVSASRERARNVLQHGVGEWVDRCDFSVLKDEKQRKTAEAMRQRLVQLGRENEGKDVGFSLEG